MRYELRGDVFIDYSTADVAALKNFLEQPSAVEGKTNAQIIRSSFPDILPDDTSWIIALEIYQLNFVWVINNGYAYLQKLNLPRLNLAGEADFSTCEYLEELNLQINSITGVAVSAGFDGTINLSQNAIPLSKLPVPTNISSWNYQKQVINENLEYEETLEIDLSSEQIINGKTTQFLWMKTTPGAPGTLTLGVDYTENNGVFTFLNPSQLGESLRCTTINENFMSLSIAFTEYNFVLSPKIPTANETIAANSNHKPVAYYNTMGMKLQNEPANGIYIILYDNGSTEKRMK